jgi:tRNA dimethylallyltransferase
MPRPLLLEILDRRASAMFEAGLVDETRHLMARYPEASRPFTAIGYREAAQVVSGSISEREAIEETRRRTRAYAKRQMTWLRSEQNVHWVDATAPLDDQLRAVRALLDRQPEIKGV